MSNESFWHPLLPSLEAWAKWEESLAETFSRTFTAHFGKEVVLSIEEPKRRTLAEVERLLHEGAVALEMDIDQGRLGLWRLIIPALLAMRIVEPGAEVKKGFEFNPELHQEALAGFMSKFVVLFDAESERLFGKKVPISELRLLDPEDVVDGLESYPGILWKITINGSIGTGIIKIWIMKQGEGQVSQEPKESKVESARPTGHSAPTVKSVEFADFGEVEESEVAAAEPRNLDMLMDINLPITIELGRTSMLVRDILNLGPGSVIELNKLSGEPIDLYVNDKRFAKGEVVVIEENFGVRITELLRVDERIRALR